MSRGCLAWIALGVVALLIGGCGAPKPQALVANPGFEALNDKALPAEWGRGEFGKFGKTVFLDAAGARSGRHCLRLVGTPNTWTTCSAKSIAVRPETTYWISWRFRAKQPTTSRTYLFLQTNLAQRVFPHTDRRGDFPWTLNIVSYRTRPGETTLHPVLTMQTVQKQIGTSWWDDVAVWEKLPPHLEAVYRSEHPWDDATAATARTFTRTAACTVWGDRPEARIYPQTPVPADAPPAKAVALTAPGRGHDVYQLVVTPSQAMEPVSLRFSVPAGLPASCLTARIARCVPVQQVRDKSFPLGPTPDPLLPADRPEPVAPGKSAIFWIEWAPPADSKPGVHAASVSVLSGGKPVATVPLKLRRWGFDLPTVSHYRSMVLVSAWAIRRFYPGISTDDAYRKAWDLLSQHRLSGFNVAVSPSAKLKDGKLELDWTHFDRVVAAAKEYRASALTIGPMFGGGCGEGWKPRFKFCGFTPLADKGFDAVYAELNRRIAERLRQAGVLDKAYVYPYDEPEADYMDKIARLCDLIHQGDPKLKVLTTTDPATGRDVWGKVQAWIIPMSRINSQFTEQRRAAGDEIWTYNMTAAIEAAPLAHRLYMWRVARADAAGGLLWNCCWWHKINPWENPTSVAVPVGRQRERLYRYQAGQASLFYPARDGKGPLVPALRLLLIRQGVEDFDILGELAAAWREALPHLPGTNDDLVTKARAAFIAPIMLDATTPTTSHARTEALRLILGNELEVARERPHVIAYPTRIHGKLAIVGLAEPGTRLTLNGRRLRLTRSGRFQARVTEAELATGLRWAARKGTASKTWAWAGLR